jgi:hypothetical protein
MAITTCAVSGVIYSPSGAALSDVTVEAYATYPFFHTDGTLIADYKVSTTTSASGTWSLTLIETTSVSKSLTIAIQFPTGTTERMRREYAVIIPNQSSVSFNTLVT